jgi:branched-chain amino acid transport system permease protein
VTTKRRRTVDVDFLLFQSLTGIATGASLFLLAAGLSLIFGVVSVVNFAHASFYMLAAYLCYSFTLHFGADTGYWWGFILAPIAAGTLGAGVERILFSRVYGRGHYPQIVVAMGLIMILNDLFKLLWGREPKLLRMPEILAGGVALPGGTLSNAHIFGICVAAAMALGLYIFLYKTRAGKIVRAAAADPEITDAVGVNVNRLYTGIFAFACWLGGLGGVVSALQKPASLGGDMEIMLTAFIIVIIGGMGSILGSLVGSLIVGVINALGILVLPRFALVFLYILMVLILINRPYGLFGKPELR